MDVVLALPRPLFADPVDSGRHRLARLFASAAAGDGDSLAALYDATVRELYAFALWRTGRPEIAEDAVQEVFCRLAGSDFNAERVRDPRAWLLTSVRHAAIDLLRRTAREERMPESPRFVAVEDPAREAEAGRISAAIAELPSKLREALFLRHFAGLTFAEIGRVVGVPTFTAASRCRLGLARLRRRLGIAP
jgi:RNA polymerase sigma-70 factor (ECF subfamily)